MIKKTRLIVLSIILAILFTSFHVVPSCLGAEDTGQLINGEKTLRLVLVPEQNVFEQRRRYRYIAEYLYVQRIYFCPERQQYQYC